jgi:hypothetical protein
MGEAIVQEFVPIPRQRFKVFKAAIKGKFHTAILPV